jgi:hypothetical protein
MKPISALLHPARTLDRQSLRSKRRALGGEPAGLAHLRRTDRAKLLVNYLGVSEAQVLKAADQLAVDGKYAMAAQLIETAEPKFPNSEALKRTKLFAYLKLTEKNQNNDPFTFIIYSTKAGEQKPQINVDNVNKTRDAPR